MRRGSSSQKKGGLASSSSESPQNPDQSSSPAYKRSQVGKGLNVFPPSESDLNGNLTFTKKTEKDRYRALCSKQIIHCKYIHHPTLETLGIKQEVLGLIQNIGWEFYFSITCPAYIELVREFYTTYEFVKPDNFTLSSPGVVRFRLLGRTFKFSITEFNIAFGCITEEFAHTDEYLNSACDFYDQFNPIALYRATSTEIDYDPSKSKYCYLHNSSWKYIHRFFAFTFSGRKDSASVLTKAELFFLWYMQNRIKVNLGFWLATQFANAVAHKRHLILGSLITQLAVNLKLLDLNVNNLHVACSMKPLNLQCLQNMGLIEQVHGVFSFCPPGPVTQGARNVHYDSDSPEPLASQEPPDTFATPSRRRIDKEVDDLRQRLTRMEQNQLAFYRHMGFEPPFPPPQQ